MRIKHSGAKPLARAVLAIAVIALAGGCAANNAGKTGGGMKTQSYGDDGYLGRTNSYPHIPGRNMALNYANDAAMMRAAIRDVRFVNGANITFNGADAYVALKLDPSLDVRRIPTVEREAATVLRFNFPRYVVHVSSLK